MIFGNKTALNLDIIGMENICKKGKIEHKIGYDVCRGEDLRGDLRYDLTLIYPEDAVGELPRTFGHYHTQGYAELFEVIEGKIMALTQKHGAEPDMIEEAYLIEAGAGDKFVILPDFGFTNINQDKSKNLLFSNWVGVKVENQYDFIKRYNGFCYRAIRDDNGNITFEKNENYKKIPKLVKLKPKDLPKELEDLDFLSNPEKYSEFLTIKNLYEKI